MESTRSTEIRVGIVSILAIALLIGGVLLGKGFSFGVNTATIAIRFPASGGLESGSPVVVNGVKRGKVVNVINDNGSVLVHAELNDARDIYTDATALVTILEITGGKKIEITPGKAPSQFDISKEMPGKLAADLSGLVTDIGEISGDAKQLVRRLDTITGQITALLADGTVIQNIRSIASDGAILATDARVWLQTNKGTLQASVNDLKTLTTDLRAAVTNNEPKLSKILDGIDKTIVEVEGTLKKADGAIVNVDSLISTINGVVQDFKTKKGIANALVYDEQLAKKLDSTFVVLQHFLTNAHKYGVNVNVGLGKRP